MKIPSVFRMCSVGLACCCMMAAPCDAFAQLEYLNPGVGAALGFSGALAKGPHNTTGGGGGIVVGNDHVSLGLAYNKTKSGGNALEYGMVQASVIEKGLNKPVGMAVSAGYTFADGMNDAALVPISIAAFRRVFLAPSFALIPEIGATKFMPVGSGAADSPVVFSGALTFASYFQNHGAFVTGPQGAYSDGRFSVGFCLALVFGMGDGR